jgi:hypothetical protein
MPAAVLPGRTAHRSGATVRGTDPISIVHGEWNRARRFAAGAAVTEQQGRGSDRSRCALAAIDRAIAQPGGP